MTALLIDTDTTVDRLVAAAHQQWVDALAHRNNIDPTVAHTVLVQVADEQDQPLCITWGRLCCTPHGLIKKDCCDDVVCLDHEAEHDKFCAELAAQERENASYERD